MAFSRTLLHSGTCAASGSRSSTRDRITSGFARSRRDSSGSLLFSLRDGGQLAEAALATARPEELDVERAAIGIAMSQRASSPGAQRPRKANQRSRQNDDEDP